jgi:hypothetical protein
MGEIRETGKRFTVRSKGNAGLPEFSDVMWDTVTWLYVWDWNGPDDLYENPEENTAFQQNEDVFARPETC